MMNLLLSVCFAIFSFLNFAEPDWVINYGKSAQYPADLYITGFATASAKEKDANALAEDNARANLARSITVNIQSVVIDKLIEKNNQSTQSFKSITQSTTNIQLSGVKTEIYKKDKLVYALAYVKKSELARIYGQNKDELVTQIKRLIAFAETDEKNAQFNDAADKYIKTYPLFDELNQTACILQVADPKYDVLTIIRETNITREEVAQRVEKLLAQTVASIDDGARALAYQLSKQRQSSSDKLIVTPFSYQDTKMNSAFSRYFVQALENQLQKYQIGAVVRQASDVAPRSISIMRDIVQQSGAQQVLEGNYWDQGSKIKIIGRLRDVQSGQILASAETELDTLLLSRYGLNARPANYLKMLADQKAFREDEVVSSAIQLDVWTNKGNENLLYVEDEIMKIYVRVNRPAHIRILYNTADGQRALLYNDYYIDETKVNMAVEIPQEFQCAAPFGSEMMVVVARTEPFPKLETVVEGGYEFVVSNDTRKLAAGVRGFIKPVKKDETPQQTETRLILTTIPK